MIGAELRQHRKALALTQAQLATALGCDVTTIARWERAERAIPPYLHLALRTLESPDGLD